MVSLNEVGFSELDHVQVAVYNAESGGQEIDFNETDFSGMLRSTGKNLHWETLVKVREEGEQVWVLVGMDLERMIEVALQPVYDSRRDRDAS